MTRDPSDPSLYVEHLQLFVVRVELTQVISPAAGANVTKPPPHAVDVLGVGYFDRLELVIGSGFNGQDRRPDPHRVRCAPVQLSGQCIELELVARPVQ